jgi:hypothetical protein
MTTVRFASWVEPIASRYRESCEEAMRLARTLSDEDLQLPSGDPEWSVRDEFAHISSGAAFVEMLRAIVRGERPDTTAFADVDALNARNIAERRNRPVQELARDIEANGHELQELLAQLTDDDENRQPAGIPFALKDLLGGNSQHDHYHLAQIRQACEARREATT